MQITAARSGARHVRGGGSITFFSGGASRHAIRGMANIAAANGRVGTAEDVAQAVLVLVTSSFVTGIVLPVDGGLPLAAL